WRISYLTDFIGRSVEEKANCILFCDAIKEWRKSEKLYKLTSIIEKMKCLIIRIILQEEIICIKI
ncbi:MAG: hypothetical protein RR271_08270, partial [Oscillospiraceae bacterium]